MRKRKGVLKNFVVALVLLAALVLSLILLADKRGEVRCSQLNITITDSAELHFVDGNMVRGWLDSARIRIVGEPMSGIDLYALRQTIASRPYVDTVGVNSDMQGRIYVTIGQYRPRIRVLSENGYNFYADTVVNIIPLSGNYALDVPLVTGYIRFSFATDFFGLLDQKNRGNDAEYLKKLINFVEFVERDAFLSRLVTQVYLLPDRNIELMTANVGQVIVFGSLDNAREKLGKICDFFAQAPREVASGLPCKIVVAYKGQVVLRGLPQAVPSGQNIDKQ